MSDNSSSPVFIGQALISGDHTLVPEILDLDGRSQVRMTDEAGREIVIPFEFLTALSSRAGSAYTTIGNTLDEQRRLFLGDLTELGLAAQGRGLIFTLPDATSHLEDGVPVLKWMRAKDNSADGAGWALYLAGADDAIISMARWNDRDALLNLVTSMADRETLLVMAGMTHPGPIAALSARMSASTMRGNRELPAMDTKRVRNVLIDAELDADHLSEQYGKDFSRYSAARVRALNIESLGRKVPVAIAVGAPSIPIRELTATEKQLGWRDRAELEKQLRDAATAPWVQKAKDSLIAAGWRVIDMPRPSSRHYSSREEIFWVTRISAETWTSVSAAAQIAAASLTMSRGTPV